METRAEIKQYFSNNEYNKVVELTEVTYTTEETVLRISSLVMLERWEEALKCFLENRSEIYFLNPLDAIEMNMSLRVSLHQYDEAHEDVNYYRNEKYISQQVEEVIAGLDKKLREAEKYELLEHNKSPKSMDEVMEKARTTDDQTFIMLALSQLSQHQEDIPFYTNDYLNFLIGDYQPDIKSFALMLLNLSKYDKIVSFDKFGKHYETNPNYLTLPFMDERYGETIKSIESGHHDQSVARVAINLFTQYVLSIFPDEWCIEGEEDKIKVAFLSLGASYMNTPYDPSPYDLLEIESIKAKIKAIIERKVS